MMDLSLSETHRTIRDTARAFARSEVAPAAAAWDAAGELPRTVIDRLGELGFLGILVPEEAGGAGLDRLACALVVEELARASGALAAAVAVHNAVAATAPARASVLATGQLLGLVQGSAIVIGASGGRFVVASGDGLVSSEDGATLTPERHWLGLRGAIHRLATDGEPAQLPLAWSMLAAAALGVGEGALEQAAAYARERKQFGRPIADFQAIQWMLADGRTELDAARALVERACATGAATHAAMAKLAAPAAALRTADRALQIHGGYGYTREYPVERAVRDARVLTDVAGGPDELRTFLARAG